MFTRKKKSWRQLLIAASVSFLVMGTMIFTSCNDLTGSGGIAEDSRSVRAATPINSVAGLSAIDTNPSGDYILMADLTLSLWTPICSTTPFTGTFDGNGYTITIDAFSPAALSRTNPLGVFSRVGGSGTNPSITNLKVNVAAGAFSTTALNVGGIAGYASGSSSATALFSGVSVTGTLNATYRGTNTSDGFKVGGVVGAGDGITITNSSSGLNITARGNSYNTSAGGIAGYVKETLISDSYATGAISLTATATNFDWDDSWQIYAGGLVGYQGIESSIVKCYATGTVQANAPFPYAGGLVGYSSIVDCLIENSYATGNVTASSDGQYVWAGGLIGGNAYNSVVSKCYALGTVTVTNGSLSPIYPPDYTNPGAAAGGIAGYNYYTSATTVQYCAALNKNITGSGGILLLHRVAGGIGDGTGHDGTLINNIANSGMTLSTGAETNVGANALGGANAAAQPSQANFTALGWDFTTIWVMSTSTGYPVLR